MKPPANGNIGIRRTLLTIGALCCLWGAASMDAMAAGSPLDRDAATLRMVQLARAGRVDEARSTLHAYLDAHPDDGTMLYNLACLDLVLEDTDQALVDLEAALDAGYTNFRLIETDQSLKSLRGDPAAPSHAHEVSRLAAAAGLLATAWTRQVHGADVLHADAPGCRGEADALWTDAPGLGVRAGARRPCGATLHHLRPRPAQPSPRRSGGGAHGGHGRTLSRRRLKPPPAGA